MMRQRRMLEKVGCGSTRKHYARGKQNPALMMNLSRALWEVVTALQQLSGFPVIYDVLN
jgi:hypothetical protein